MLQKSLPIHVTYWSTIHYPYWTHGSTTIYQPSSGEALSHPTYSVPHRLQNNTQPNGETNGNDGEWDRGDPEEPLTGFCVPDVGGVHAKEAGDEGEWEEDDADEGKTRMAAS